MNSTVFCSIICLLGGLAAGPVVYDMLVDDPKFVSEECPIRPADPEELPPGWVYVCDSQDRTMAHNVASDLLVWRVEDPSKVPAANLAWHIYWNGARSGQPNNTEKVVFKECQ